MGYNQENYKRVREEYRTKYLRAYEEANRRMAEVHAKSPEIAAIDRELSMAGAEIALAVIGKRDLSKRACRDRHRRGV